MAFLLPSFPEGARSRWLVALGALLALAACDVAPRPIVLGVAGPFSTPAGASMRRGVEIAARELNAGGGVRGRPLELRFLDDQSDPEGARRAAEAFLADDEVVAVVGHPSSGAMLHASSIYERGLPAVVTSGSGEGTRPSVGWVFRIVPGDSVGAEALARAADGWRSSTAILYANDDAGRGLADSFHSALVRNGGVVVSSDPYLPSTPDFRPFLERMKTRETGLVLIAGREEAAARIIDQAREIGFTADFLGGPGLERLASMGSAYDGTRVGVHYHPQTSPAAAAFDARFRSAFGEGPDAFAALGYDAVQLVVGAVQDGGADRTGIRERLSQTGTDGRLPHEGVTGTIRFGSGGDPVEKAFRVGEVRDGRISLERGR